MRDQSVALANVHCDDPPRSAFGAEGVAELYRGRRSENAGFAHVERGAEGIFVVAPQEAGYEVADRPMGSRLPLVGRHAVGLDHEDVSLCQ